MIISNLNLKRNIQNMSINTNTSFSFIFNYSEGGGSWDNFYLCFLPSAEFRNSWIRDFIYRLVLLQKGVMLVKGYISNQALYRKSFWAPRGRFWSKPNMIKEYRNQKTQILLCCTWQFCSMSEQKHDLPCDGSCFQESSARLLIPSPIFPCWY